METAQYVLWGVAIILDVVAAAVGGQAEGWNLHPEHFSERHGLFVIIALGESLIVAASGLTADAWPPMLVISAVMAVACTGALWWTYFASAKEQLEHALMAATGNARSMLARDAFSIIHFPMIGGIVGYAVVVEEVLAHPDHHLPLESRLMLAVSTVLFVGGMALAQRRAGLPVSRARLWSPIVTGAAVLATGAFPGWVNLAMVFGGVALVGIGESRSPIHTAHH